MHSAPPPPRGRGGRGEPAEDFIFSPFRGIAISEIELKLGMNIGIYQHVSLP